MHPEKRNLNSSLVRNEANTTLTPLVSEAGLCEGSTGGSASLRDSGARSVEMPPSLPSQGYLFLAAHPRLGFPLRGCLAFMESRPLKTLHIDSGSNMALVCNFSWKWNFNSSPTLKP